MAASELVQLRQRHTVSGLRYAIQEFSEVHLHPHPNLSHYLLNLVRIFRV